MAQKDATKRQSLVIKYLRSRARTFDEIDMYLETESNIQSCDLNISKRTFQRDIQEIKSIWGIEIEYNRSLRKYEIGFDPNDAKDNKLMEAFDILNTLNVSERVSEYIHFETRKASGTHLILDIITAIKNKTILDLYHQKYWEDTFTERKIEPLGIKEYKYRWYLVAKDLKDNKIKSFGLDRIKGIQQTNIRVEKPTDFNISEFFEFTYGAVGAERKKVEEVILSFTPFQGKFIKALPMHHSQTEITDNDEEYRISLEIAPVIDFVMDIQQYAHAVKVIKPKWLADQIKSNLQEALNQY